MPGPLEIVIASVGLSLGVFTETAYTVIVIVPLITSIFAAVSLRIVVRDWRGTDKEQERLDREEALAKNWSSPRSGSFCRRRTPRLDRRRPAGPVRVAEGGTLDDSHRGR